MPHTTPNIPESQPDNRKVSTINATMNAAKGNANNHYGDGMAANSSSSGNSIGLDGAVEQGRSFWAMLTRKLRFFNTPPLAWLRIPNAQKPMKDGKIYRDPWESYDGYGFDHVPGNLREAVVTNGIMTAPAQELGLPQGNNNEGRFMRYGPNGSRGDNDIKKNGFPGIGSNPDDPAMWDVRSFYNQYFWKGPESRYLEWGADMNGGLDNGGGITIQFGPNGEWYRGFCPHYFWCYGWCEIIEDLDFGRLGHYWCDITPRYRNSNFIGTRQIESNGNLRFERDRKDPKKLEPWPNPDPLAKIFSEGAETIKPRKDSCISHFIPKEHMSHGGLWGSAMGPNMAHEVNNADCDSGEIVRMFKGAGEYYLFQSQTSPGKTNEDLSPSLTIKAGSNYKLSVNDKAPYHFWANAWHINRSF